MILPWILTIVIRDKFITNEENDAKNLIQGMDECECYQLLITKIVSHAVMQHGQWKSSFNYYVGTRLSLYWTMFHVRETFTVVEAWNDFISPTIIG